MNSKYNNCTLHRCHSLASCIQNQSNLVTFHHFPAGDLDTSLSRSKQQHIGLVTSSHPYHFLVTLQVFLYLILNISIFSPFLAKLSLPVLFSEMHLNGTISRTYIKAPRELIQWWFQTVSHWRIQEFSWGAHFFKHPKWLKHASIALSSACLRGVTSCPQPPIFRCGLGP